MSRQIRAAHPRAYLEQPPRTQPNDRYWGRRHSAKHDWPRPNFNRNISIQPNLEIQTKHSWDGLGDKGHGWTYWSSIGGSQPENSVIDCQNCQASHGLDYMSSALIGVEH